MAELIVDRLELIEVAEEDRELELLAAALGAFARERLIPGPAVAEARQRVLVTEPVELLEQSAIEFLLVLERRQRLELAPRGALAVVLAEE